ncbi:MAG TPA: DinB family protein [Bacteroidia bacterium]|nr:DinB family protein [Bacteroidia bacterium]
MTSIADHYLLESIKSFRGLKSNAEKAIAQISDDELHFQPDAESNSVSILMQHMSGNMLSRFTDFLSSDGEKPGRNRDQEFIDRNLNRDEILKIWNKGWECLLGSLQALQEDDLMKTVTIRQEQHTVLRAVQRQLVHYAYHTGQIVFLCKMIRKNEFISLSIPRGQSAGFTPPPAEHSR